MIKQVWEFLIMNFKTPQAELHLEKLIHHFCADEPFTFIRYSDGENEVLRNRFLEINAGLTTFRGRVFENKFPIFDSKKFDPRIHQKIRADLLASALFKGERYYKGILTSHNDAIRDREFMIRLNGGFDEHLTFTDLFLNSNYSQFINTFIPHFSNFKNKCVIANYRSNLIGPLKDAIHVPVGDNFFSDYENARNNSLRMLVQLPPKTLILSSASTLTKVLGYELYKVRKDLYFVDVGTTINHLLSLDSNTREYHTQNQSLIKKFMYEHSKRYRIRW